MSYNVLLTNHAAQDLDDMYEFIYLSDSPGKAEYVFMQIEKAIDSLTTFPERGSYPNELKSLGIKQYREVFFKPYRLIYQIKKETVYIMLVTDGRRDMQTLLSKRLLEV
ncbi:MAG: type II toxin-antitoxin system RelE/ParE family toxin [Bacteroidetes bacterium]|nr:type II toxin-antitoxin system RelE/ParE family toxin [Deltaproteobacteria bacterium]MBT7463950.1 type II toxin-antitoxin system RelE/ParE family toxin [Bacteroidota bacterium]